MPNNPSLIIFDLGKVIFEFRNDLFYNYVAGKTGKALDDIKSKANLAIDEMAHQLERGELSPQEIHEYVNKLWGYKFTWDEFKREWNGIFLEPTPGIGNYLSELRNSYEIVALTNTNSLHEEAWSSKYKDVLSHFEHIYTSHALGMRKPEERIFHHVLNDRNTQPENTLYFDDMPENVEAAARLGIEAILVSSTGILTNKLQELIDNGR